jgi:hypothetical protein
MKVILNPKNIPHKQFPLTQNSQFDSVSNVIQTSMVKVMCKHRNIQCQRCPAPESIEQFDQIQNIDQPIYDQSPIGDLLKLVNDNLHYQNIVTLKTQELASAEPSISSDEARIHSHLNGEQPENALAAIRIT